MSDAEVVVADAAVVEEVVVQDVKVEQLVFSDAALEALKSKQKVNVRRYMIGWKTLNSLIARMEAAERVIQMFSDEGADGAVEAHKEWCRVAGRG